MGCIRMKKIYKVVNAFFVLIIMFSGIAYASGSGTNAGRILSFGIGARQIGMGESFVGIADDINTIHWNPAGLALIRHRAVSFMYVPSILDTYYGYIGGVCPLKIGTAGFSIVTLQGGDLEVNYDDGSSKTIKAQQDYVLTLSFAGKMRGGILAGGNIKVINSTLAEDYKATAFAGDVGFLAGIMRNNLLTAGIVIQNLGTKLKYLEVAQQLPVTYKAGLGSKITLEKIHTVQASLDTIITSDDETKINTGIEWTYNKLISIRGGYKFKEQAWTVGIGLSYTLKGTSSNYNLDYAFGMLGDIDEEDIHRVSFSVKF